MDLYTQCCSHIDCACPWREMHKKFEMRAKLITILIKKIQAVSNVRTFNQHDTVKHPGMSREGCLAGRQRAPETALCFLFPVLLLSHCALL